MLKAALGGMSPDEKTRYPKLIEDVEWLLTETAKLEDMRNNSSVPTLIEQSQLVGRNGLGPDDRLQRK